MKKIILAVTLLIVMANANAVNWTNISTGTDGTVLEIDKSRVKRIGNTVRAWERITYGTNQSSSVNPFGNPKQTIELVMINCEFETSALISIVNYDENNRTLNSGTTQNPKHEPIIPGSIGEAFEDYLCKSSLPTNKQKARRTKGII